MNLLNPVILYEDRHLLIIEKPAGVTVNKAETEKDPTVQDWAAEKLATEIINEKGTPFAERAGIVHRLDKETSGILVIAKNEASLENLQAQFKEHQVVKKYLTLVHGKMELDKGTVNAPIGRLPWNRMHFGVFPGGREAVTDYKLVETYHDTSLPGEIYSLLEITLHTGRTHQIRVHMKYLNHPVVGDELYAGRKTARDDRKFCSRQFLHAYYLELFHPLSHEKLVFESPLPLDLQKVLSSLTPAA